MIRLYLLLLVLSGCAMLCSGFLVNFIGSSDKGLLCETLIMIKLQTLLTVGKYFSMEKMLIVAAVLFSFFETCNIATNPVLYPVPHRLTLQSLTLWCNPEQP